MGSKGNTRLISLPLSDRKICEGHVVLFLRKDSNRWQARIRRGTGQWVVFSTGNSDIQAAKTSAETRYREIRYAQKMGKVDITRRFKSVCLQCRKELYEEADRTGRELPRDLAQVIDKYITPILGDYLCHNIPRDVLLSNPRLCLDACWPLLLTGHYQEAAELLAHLEKIAQDMPAF